MCHVLLYTSQCCPLTFFSVCHFQTSIPVLLCSLCFTRTPAPVPWVSLVSFTVFFFFFFQFLLSWILVLLSTFCCLIQRCLAFGFFFCLAITITKLLCLTLPNSRHMKFRAVFHRSAWPALLFFFSGSSPTQIHNLLLLTTHTKSACTFLCWTINQFLCCR